jgi:hypothetical protein
VISDAAVWPKGTQAAGIWKQLPKKAEHDLLPGMIKWLCVGK